ncbi:hypothetical protein V6N13_020236 [Hibiscus sabdariffa]
MPKQPLYARKQVTVKPQAKPVLSYWIPMVPGTLNKMLASTPKQYDTLALCNKPQTQCLQSQQLLRLLLMPTLWMLQLMPVKILWPLPQA